MKRIIMSVMLALVTMTGTMTAAAGPADAHVGGASAFVHQKAPTLCQQVRAWSGAGCTSKNTRAFWKAQAKRRADQRASRTRRSSGSTVWDRLAKCESGGNWAINTGNGYYGGLQFSLSSWRAAGGSGRPDLASRTEQIRRGEVLKGMQGWGAWPACSRKLGLR